MNRRRFLSMMGLTGLSLFAARFAHADPLFTTNFLKRKPVTFPFMLTDEQWHARLSPETYEVMRLGENEDSGSSPLLRERRRGVYHCRGCDQPLFDSNAKIRTNDWPTFRGPINGKFIGTSADYGHLLPRNAVHCANCGSHLGYKFAAEGAAAETWRYPINGAAMVFKAT